MSPRSEEYRTSPVATDERQVRDTATEARELTPADIRTLDFVLHMKDAQAYITDETRGKRDHPEAWARVTATANEGTLEPAALDQLARDLGSLAVSAKRDITGNARLGEIMEMNPQLAGAADYAKERIDYESARTILQHSGLYPPPAIAEAGSKQQQLWTEAVNDRVRDLATTDRLEEIPSFLREAKDYQERHQASGAAPTAHTDLDRYLNHYLLEQNQRTEEFQPGYNAVHTTAFTPETTAQEAVAYVRGRMSEMLDGASDRQVDPAGFAKAFVEPHLDENLAANFGHYDLSQQEYIQGNIVEPEQRSLLHGPTDDPQVHLEATYSRTIRNSIARTGMAEAASRHDPAEFAIGVVRTANLASDIKEWLETASNHWSTDQASPPATTQGATSRPSSGRSRRRATGNTSPTKPAASPTQDPYLNRQPAWKSS